MTASSTRAPPRVPSPAGPRGRTVTPMGNARGHACAGVDDAQCLGEPVAEVGPGVWLCEDCREGARLDRLIPERAPRPDDGLTRPVGDPREAGHGTAA